MPHPATDWSDRAGTHPDEAPIPLHRLHAGEERAQRDRMILILLGFFALAVLATAA